MLDIQIYGIRKNLMKAIYEIKKKAGIKDEEVKKEFNFETEINASQKP